MQFKSLAAATAVLAYAFQAAVADEVHLVNCYGDQTDGVVVVSERNKWRNKKAPK